MPGDDLTRDVDVALDQSQTRRVNAAHEQSDDGRAAVEHRSELVEGQEQRHANQASQLFCAYNYPTEINQTG